MNKKPLYIVALIITFFSCKQSEKTERLIENYNVINTKSNYINTEVSIYTTAENTNKRLYLDSKKVFVEASQPLETEVAIFVNPKKQFQEFLGIGGAITDASAEVFSKLSKDKQEELLNAYFTEDGINYNIIRTSIHSSDFGLGSHTYIEEGDKELKTFSIEMDRKKTYSNDQARTSSC